LGKRAFKGIPNATWASAQLAQAARQPHSLSMKAVMGQPRVLANPATRVTPVIDALA